MPEKVLHQVIAIEKGVKSRCYSAVGELYKLVQKPDLFNGASREYQPKDSESEQLPADHKRVQFKAEEVLEQVAALETEAMDVEAAKDWANCSARADVVVDGRTIVKDAPATFLLALEKRLSDMAAFVEKLPTLDEADDWSADTNTATYKTAAVRTHRTKKLQRPIVLYDATAQHPAQTQLITEDVIDGFWNTVKVSGALPVPRKRQLLKRVQRMSDAVKAAREAANGCAAPAVPVGQILFDYLFSKT